MIEVEIKVRILDPELTRKILVRNNGFYRFSLHHEDTYFNMPKGLKNFQKTDEALRLRKSVQFKKNEIKQDRIIINYFTYKGRKIDAATKTRKEIEVEIDEIIKMKEILIELGFQEMLTIIKERDLYEVNFKSEKIEVLIDYLPILNCYFLEIEIISENIEKVTNTREHIFEFLEVLGFKRDESIRESYLELVLNQIRK